MVDAEAGGRVGVWEVAGRDVETVEDEGGQPYILGMVLGCCGVYPAVTGQEAESGNTPAGGRCVPNGGPNETTIYAVFADFTAPNTLGGGGLGTNPLSPRHVVLVK